MSRLNEANIKTALEIIARYPRPKSALIPLLHLAQEQNGYVTREAMVNQAIQSLDMTRVIIAHRPETIASAKRVIVMVAGKVHMTALAGA